jgi:hypothetical protein
VWVLQLFDVGVWLVFRLLGFCRSTGELPSDGGLHAKLGQGSALQIIPGMRLRNEQTTLLCKT